VKKVVKKEKKTASSIKNITVKLPKTMGFDEAIERLMQVKPPTKKKG